MTATVVYQTKEWEEVSGMNVKSILKKLSKIGIVISEVDALFIQLTSGYTTLENGIKIKIK
jgi:hypothetical protein